MEAVQVAVPSAEQSGRDWSGHRIAPDAAGQSLDPFAGRRGPAPAAFSRCSCRRVFEAAEPPAPAPAGRSADWRSVRRVKGRQVGRRPARSQPAPRRPGRYDLVPGPNVVAVRVTYDGEATWFSMPAIGPGLIAPDRWAKTVDTITDPARSVVIVPEEGPQTERAAGAHHVMVRG